MKIKVWWYITFRFVLTIWLSLWIGLLFNIQDENQTFIFPITIISVFITSCIWNKIENWTWFNNRRIKVIAKWLFIIPAVWLALCIITSPLTILLIWDDKSEINGVLYVVLPLVSLLLISLIIISIISIKEKKPLKKVFIQTLFGDHYESR